MTLFRRRRAHGDENGSAGFHRVSQIVGESETAAAMALQQFGQELLVNRDLPAVERSQFLLVVVHQDDLVAHVRKTCSGHQADIS